ncbi:MAG TPA: VOC family protein [Thermoanaerobaculia bacterium]|jgi:catechol 2,3-dioxygenase-like lactoylglutathione lyase family enzyme|nr:VOC family protein [Thermoanaerobaculia bacterium]
MLREHDAVATIAVRDTAAARKFYEGKLGLEPEDDRGDEVLTYGSGQSRVFVYRSDFAGTNKATSATWTVDDVDALARELKSKGVPFERYDMPGMTHEGDVHVAGSMRAAWFRDPDGNILSIVSG